MAVQYYYIVRNRRGHVATTNRIKTDKAPFGYGEPYRFDTRKKAQNFADKLNAYFKPLMFLAKDQFKAIRQSEKVEDPKPETPKIIKDEKYLIDKYTKKGTSYETGTQLPYIAKDAAEVYGDSIIDILIPISSCYAGEPDNYTFHCFGKATDIAAEVPRLMPFSERYFASERMQISDAKTCYWGKNNNLSTGNYLPFLAEDSVYHIESIAKTADKTTIKLIRGLCWRAYL